MTEDVAALVEEAKGTFDLGGFLHQAVAKVEDKEITVYTDQAAGEALGGEFGDTGKVIHKGPLGEAILLKNQIKLYQAVIDAAEEAAAKSAAEAELSGEDAEPEPPTTDSYRQERDKAQERLEEIQPEIDRLRAQLEETSLTIGLRYLPPLIIKDAKLKSRKHIGIKKVTEDDYEEYMTEFNAQILSRACTYVETPTGRNPGIDPEEARNLYGLLPYSEQERLDAAINKLVFQGKIAASLALDADF